jgi:preprotein translocase subunit SecG
MDAYQGSVYDPVSLHKYLYANANPVMYVDPSGYMGIGDMSAAMAINTVLMSSCISGCIGLGLSIIHDLRSVINNQMTIGAMFKNALYSFVGSAGTAAFLTMFALLSPTLMVITSIVLMGVSIYGVSESYQKAQDCFNQGDIWGGIVHSIDALVYMCGTAFCANGIIAGFQAMGYNLNAPMFQKPTNSPRTLQDIINDSTIYKKAHSTTQYETPGDYDSALADFYSLKPTNVTTYSNGTTVGYLPDGSTINVRPNSTFQAPTLEVTPVTGNTIKIRYTGG